MGWFPRLNEKEKTNNGWHPLLIVQATPVRTGMSPTFTWNPPMPSVRIPKTHFTPFYFTAHCCCCAPTLLHLWQISTAKVQATPATTVKGLTCHLNPSTPWVLNPKTEITCKCGHTDTHTHLPPSIGANIQCSSEGHVSEKNRDPFD